MLLYNMDKTINKLIMVLSIASLGVIVKSTESCEFHEGNYITTFSCEIGCCGKNQKEYCCEGPDTTWVIIVGSTAGVLCFVACCIAVVCCIVKLSGKRGRLGWIIHPTTGGVMTSAGNPGLFSGHQQTGINQPQAGNQPPTGYQPGCQQPTGTPFNTGNQFAPPLPLSSQTPVKLDVPPTRNELHI